MTKKVATTIDPVCMDLVRAGLLTYKQLNEVHRLVQETGGSIDDALVSKGLVSREQIAKRRAPRTGKPALKIGYSLDLVKSGLLTFKQLNECHREARSSRGTKTVVDVMLEKGYVSDVQLATITPSSQGAKHKKFSSSWDLFRAGAVSLKALNDCHRHIKLESPEKSLKEALLERGYITREKLEELERKRVQGEETHSRGALRSPFMEKYKAELDGIPEDLKQELRREHLASEGVSSEEDQGRADFQGSKTLMEVEPEEAPAGADVGFQSAQTMMGDDDEPKAPTKPVRDEGDGPVTRAIRGAKTFLTEEAESFRSEKTVMGDDDEGGTVEFRAAQTFMDGGAPEKPKETDSGSDIRAAQTFLDAGDVAPTGSDPDIRGANTFLDVGEEAARPAPKAVPQQGGTFMDMDVEAAGPAGMFGGSETGSGVGPGMLKESRSGGSGAEFQKADTLTGEGEGDTFMDVEGPPGKKAATPNPQTQSAMMREAFEKAGKSASSSSKTDVDMKTPSKTDVGSSTGSSAGTGTGTGTGSGTGTGTGTGSSAAGTKASTGGATEAQTGAAKPAKKKKDEEDAYNHPLVGKVIGGCRIVKKLGEGGMGAVFLAEHTKLKRQSVIKVVPAHLSQNKQLIARFEREARAAAVVQHPNIVAVHNVGEENGVHYIEMEYVDGSALDAELKEKKFIEPMECLRIIKDACRGLAEAHKNGIIHRDIKPDNIMMTRKRQVKIADFGLARVGGSEEMELTKVGQILGTPAYMSPEQCQGKPTDHRADIYSLGATFYAMITGKRPFTGSSVMDIMKKHIDEAPNSPREYNRDNNLPDVAVPIEQIILQMMAKKPEERFQSAEDVIEAIDRFMRAEGTEHLAEVQKLLGDDWKLLKKLGQGGMGAVYSAKANKTKDRVKAGDLVAIKVLNREVNPEEVKRFEQEAKLALEIDHENIIRVLEYRISPDMNYIVMEFVEGKSVRDIIRDQKKLAPKEATRIVREASKGLARAHELGIIHRDIKPDNLMIAKSGTVKVADFGIAKHVEGASELTQAGVVVGTPHYMSPEQCVGASRGIKITTQADIYSLGATLYFMVTGQKPFEGDTQMTIILQHLNQAPTPPRELDDKIDESLSNVVLNMMAKKPRYRYATLADVVKDLDAAEKGKRVKKHRKVDVSFEETGRNKVIVGVGGGVIAAMFFAVFALSGRKDTVAIMNAELDKGKSAVERLLQEKKFNAALDLAKATESKVLSYDTSKQYEARFKDRLGALMQSAQGPKDANDRAVLDLRAKLDLELKSAQASAQQIRDLADEIVPDTLRQPCFEHYGKAYALGKDASAANFGDDPIVTRDEGTKVCREILIELEALGEKRLGLDVAYVERELVRDRKFYQAAQADLEAFGRNWGELRVPGYDAQRVVALAKAAAAKAEDYKEKDGREFPGNLGKVEQVCYGAFAAEAREIERGYPGQKKKSGEVSTQNIVKIFQEARATGSKSSELSASLHGKLIEEHLELVKSSLEQSAHTDVRTALNEVNELVRTLTPNKLARAQTAAQKTDQLADAIRERFGDTFAEELKTTASKQIPKAASEAWAARKEALEAISWGSKTSPLTGTPNGARRFLEAASAYKAIMNDDEAKFAIEVTVEGKTEAVAIRKLAEKELSDLNYNLGLLAPFNEANNDGNMHLVPGGSFVLGTDDADAPANQRPAQTVEKKGFFIDRTEVTVGEYDHFLHTDASGRYQADLDTKDKRLFLCFQHDPDPRFCYPGEPSSPTGHMPRNFDPQHGKNPVQFVTWYDAYAFAHWAGKRLPSEAEWEKAASWDPEKKKKNAYPWGDTFDPRLLVAATADDQWPELKGVGQILGNKSPSGPLDMAGSLWEWVDEAYKGYPGSRYVDADYGERFKVIRGGSYEDHREAAFRTTYRDRRLPEESYENVGFRCVRGADEGEKK
jgi:serine/threonine protein kinase/formylglycine-generating enzyme required for sulfatase activity